MSDLIKVTGDIGPEASAKLKRLSRLAINGVITGVNRETIDLHRYIVKEHLSGASRTDPEANFRKGKLRRRTGDFVRKTKRHPAKLDGTMVIGGTDFEADTANVHVGEKGKVTIIRPKSKQWLAIPLPPVLTRAGVPRGKPRDYKNLFFYQKRGAKHALLMESRGGRVRPMYLLVKMVKIRARIHPKQILAERRNKIAAGIRKAIMESVKRGLI